MDDPNARRFANVPVPDDVKLPPLAVVKNRFVNVPLVEKKFVVVAEVPVAFVNIRSVRLRTFANKLVNVPDVENRLVVVAEVPVAFTKVKFCKVEEAVAKILAKVPKLAEAFVKVPLVEKKFVVVADVPVAFTNVKFWRVVEPVVNRSPEWLIENLVVEATLRSKSLPVKPVSASPPITVPVELRCSTESLAYGEVVPMPTFVPSSVITPVEFIEFASVHLATLFTAPVPNTTVPVKSGRVYILLEPPILAVCIVPVRLEPSHRIIFPARPSFPTVIMPPLLIVAESVPDDVKICSFCVGTPPIPTFLLESTTSPVPPTVRSEENRLVEEAVVEKRLVVVAEVPVAFVNIRSVRLRTFANKLVNVPDVENRLVVVAEVPVAFTKVKFCKVEEAVAKILAKVPKLAEAFVKVPLVEKKLVVVALVEVELIAVKF